MGVDIDNRFIVGLEYEELQKLVPEDEDFMDFIEDNDLVYASYYYDAPVENQFYGFPVGNYLSPSEAVKKILEAEEKFIRLFNLKPIIFAGAHVW